MRNPRIHESRLIRVGAVGLLACLAACDVFSTVPTPTPDPGVHANTPAPVPPPPPATYWNGAWAGTTSEGLPVSFSIVDYDWVNDVSVTIKLTGDCGVSQTKVTASGRVGWTMDGWFWVGDSTSAVSMTGIFSTYTAGSGSVAAVYTGTLANGATCHSKGSASWTATIQ